MFIDSNVDSLLLQVRSLARARIAKRLVHDDPDRHAAAVSVNQGVRNVFGREKVRLDEDFGFCLLDRVRDGLGASSSGGKTDGRTPEIAPEGPVEGSPTDQAKPGS